MVCELHSIRRLPEPGERMTLRIERLKGRIRLSGEFRIGHLDQVKIETERCESPVVLDLEEVDLIDVEGVRFLNACEAKGIAVPALFALHSGMDVAGARPAERASRTVVAGFMSDERLRLTKADVREKK